MEINPPPVSEGVLFFTNFFNYRQYKFKMRILFKLKSELGEFVSEEMSVTDEQYKNLVEMSRQFYNGGYDMWLPNGFLVVPPDVVKRSILMIEIIDN